MRHILRREKSIGSIHHPLLALDAENDPLTGDFIFASVYGKRKDSHGKEHLVQADFDSQKDLEKFLLSFRKKQNNIPFWLVGYNIGYDLTFFKKACKGKIFMSGGRFITARLKNGIKVIDLMNHVSVGRLEDWIEWLELGKKYGCEKKDFSDIKERCRQDAKATYFLGSELEDFYHSLGTSMKLTRPSTALSLYLKKFFRWRFFRESDFFNEYERKAYYGGRTETFKRGKRNAYAYDVHAMYVSVMKENNFPDPNTAVFHDSGKNFEKFLKLDGIFDVDIETPMNEKIMLFPLRMNGKLVFPKGKFSGFYCSPLLREALKRGYKILNCRSFIYYRKSLPLFRKYAEFIWKTRETQKTEGMKKIAKGLGNDLYGKFGQRNPVNDFVGKLSDAPAIPKGVRVETHTMDGEEWITIPSGEKEEAVHAFPCISAFIACYAQLKMFFMLERHKDSVIACDTDSIKFADWDCREKNRTGLGEWGFEYHQKEKYFREKMYADKIKGVPKRAALFNCGNEIVAVYRKPLKFREAIRRKKQPSSWEWVFKHVSLEPSDKRAWIGLESEPISISFPLRP